MALRDPFGGSYDRSVISLPGEVWRKMPKPFPYIKHQLEFDPKYYYEISNFGRGRKTTIKSNYSTIMLPRRKMSGKLFAEHLRFHGKTIEGADMDVECRTDWLMVRAFPELTCTEDWIYRFIVVPKHYARIIRERVAADKEANTDPYVYCLYKEADKEKEYFSSIDNIEETKNIPKNLLENMLNGKTYLGYKLYRVLRKEIENKNE